MIETALYSILSGDADIAAMVSTRVYPLERPQKSALPAIVYRRVSGQRDYDMEGATELVDSRFFIECWAKKQPGKSAYLVAKELRAKVRDRFCPVGGFRETIGTTEIQGIFINGEDDSRTDGAVGTGRVKVNLDCTIWHKESET